MSSYSGSKSDAAQSSLQGFANPFRSTKHQRNFEKGLFDKTRKGSGELGHGRGMAWQGNDEMMDRLHMASVG